MVKSSVKFKVYITYTAKRTSFKQVIKKSLTIKITITLASYTDKVTSVLVIGRNGNFEPVNLAPLLIIN